MIPLIWAMMGGAIGSGLRFLIGRSLYTNSNAFPWSTFIVNLAGCLAIGLLAGLLERKSSDTVLLRWFWMAGICGGFTTFSAFSLETFQLLQQQRWVVLLPYVLGSLILGLGATWAGWQWIRS
jgi:CrcB protein